MKRKDFFDLILLGLFFGMMFVGLTLLGAING